MGMSGFWKFVLNKLNADLVLRTHIESDAFIDDLEMEQSNFTKGLTLVGERIFYCENFWIIIYHPNGDNSYCKVGFRGDSINAYPSTQKMKRIYAVCEKKSTPT